MSVALLIGAACSGDDSDEAETTTSTTSTAPASTAPTTSAATGGTGAGTPNPAYRGTPTGPGTFELCGGRDAVADIEVISSPADPDQLISDGWEQRFVDRQGAVDYVDSSGERWVRLFPGPDGSWVQIASVTCT